MKPWIVILMPAFWLALTVSACKDQSANPDVGSPSDIVFPPSNVSYSRHVQPLFNQACALSGCHDDGQSQTVRLTSYGNVYFANPQVLVAGQPDQSLLVLRIEGVLGTRMPLNLNPLNQNQITGIRTWIAEGAHNN